MQIKVLVPFCEKEMGRHFAEYFLWWWCILVHHSFVLHCAPKLHHLFGVLIYEGYIFRPNKWLLFVLGGTTCNSVGFFFSPNYIDHMIIFTKPLAKTYKLIGFDHWPMLLIHSTRLLHFVKLFCSFSCSLHLCTKWYWQRIINFCFWFIKLSFSLIQREIKKEIERRKTGKEMLDYKRKQEEELTKIMLEERNREKA